MVCMFWPIQQDVYIIQKQINEESSKFNMYLRSFSSLKLSYEENL